MSSRENTRARVIAACGLLLAFALLLQACGDDPTVTFRANLIGSQEVPANTSAATGLVVITLDRAGTSLTYTLSVQNINNAFMAHLHCCAGPGVNAGVVMFLFGPVAANGGPANGVIASGTKTSSDLVNSMAGHPLQELIDQIKAGQVYSNVHTSSPGTASGPGNLPSGEIRAQVIIAPQ